jgi:hypothetical protein
VLKNISGLAFQGFRKLLLFLFVIVINILIASASTGKVWIKHFLAGSAGGLAGVVIGHPFDTIRVRLQTSHGLYQSATDCFVKTVKGEGVS